MFGRLIGRAARIIEIRRRALFDMRPEYVRDDMGSGEGGQALPASHIGC